MPIYEYQCRQCGAVSEIFFNVGAHSDPLICSSCGGSELEKKLSAASIAVTAGPSENIRCGPEAQCYSGACNTGCCKL